METRRENLEEFGLIEENTERLNIETLSNDCYQENTSTKNNVMETRRENLEEFGLIEENTERLNIETLSNGCDQESTSTKNQNTSRKQNCCLYCRNTYVNIAKHLETGHPEEDEVKKFSILRKGSTERRKIIDLLRKKGNFDSKKFGNVEIPVRRMPNEKIDAHYAACPRCRGLYSKPSLRKHYKNCLSEGHIPNDRSLMVLSRKIGLELPSSASDILKSVFARLREDELVKLIRWDPLVISYGNKLCKKLKDPHHAKEIRAKLRQLGRFLLEIKKINREITDFSSIYNPKYYEDCIQTANSLSKISNNATQFQCPVVALSLGTLLKKVGKHMKSYIIQTEKNEKSDNLKKFMHLLYEDYGTAVSKTALENLGQLKRNKTEKLPIMEDIIKFYKYLCQTRDNFYNDIKKNGFSLHAWKELSSYTLSSIQVFNRRRPGETERMFLTDFANTKTVTLRNDLDTFSTLDITAQEAANEYLLIPLRGKLSRSVNAITDKQAFKCLKMILRYRSEAGVHKNNPYMFGLPGQDVREHRHLDACVLMRKFSVLCGASNPENLRATLLRKHFATQASVFGLEQEDISDIANHLGHEEKIHKEYYRLPIVTREITKMSRLLEKSVGKPATVTSATCSDEPPQNLGETENYDIIMTSQDKTTAPEMRSIMDSDVQITNVIDNEYDKEIVLNYEEMDDDSVPLEIENISVQSRKQQGKVKLSNYRLPIVTREVTKMSRLLEKSVGKPATVTSATCSDEPPQNLGETENYTLIMTAQDKTAALEMRCIMDSDVQITNVIDNEYYKVSNCEAMDDDSVPLNTENISVQSRKQQELPAPELRIILTPLKTSAIANKSRYQLSSDSDSESRKHDVNTKKGSRTKRTWTTPEKTITKIIFKDNFKSNTVPSYTKCKEAVQKYPDLKKRSYQQLHAWINHQIKSSSSQRDKRPDDSSSNQLRRIAWTSLEKSVVHQLFDKYINSAKLPRYILCKEAVQNYPELKQRTSMQLYAFVNNQIKKKKSVRGYGQYSPESSPSKGILTTPEKYIVKKLFLQYINNTSTPPSKDKIIEIMMKHHQLKYKSVEIVEKVISHEIEKKLFAEQLRKNATRKRLF